MNNRAQQILELLQGFSPLHLSAREQHQFLDDINILLDYAQGGGYKKFNYSRILNAFHSLSILTDTPALREVGVRGWVGKKHEPLAHFLKKYVLDDTPYTIRRSFMSYSHGTNVRPFARNFLEQVNHNTPKEGTEPPAALMMVGEYLSYDMEALLKWAGKNWKKLNRLADGLDRQLVPAFVKKRDYSKLLPSWARMEREIIAVPDESEVRMSVNGHPNYPVLFTIGRWLSPTSPAGEYIQRIGTHLTPTVYGMSLAKAKKVYDLLMLKDKKGE